MNAREVFGHWDAVRRDLLRGLEQFTEEDLDFQPAPAYQRTVGDIARHIAEAEDGWFHYVVRGEHSAWPEYPREAYPNRESITEALERVHQKTLAWLETVDQADLNQAVTTSTMTPDAECDVCRGGYHDRDDDRRKAMGDKFSLKRFRQLIAGKAEEPEDEMSGKFSLKRFYKKLNIPQDERPLIDEAMGKGLEKYYSDLYGYDKYGKEPAFLIDERMGEPYIFGYAAVRILHHEGISARTKRAVAEYTLAITRPGGEFGTPHGLSVAVSYLVAGGHLRGQQLASAVRSLAGEQDVFVSMTTEDTRALTDGLIADQELSLEERLDLLNFLLIRCQYAFARGKEMLERVLETPAISREQKKTLCTWIIHGRAQGRQEGLNRLEALMRGEEAGVFPQLTAASLGLVPEYLKRHAIVGLAQIEGDPTAVARRYLGAGQRYDAVPFDQAVGDIIETYHAEMSPAEVREMVEQGARASAFQTRLRFYQLGLKLYGPEFIRPALEDRSKKVQKWARKQLKEK